MIGNYAKVDYHIDIGDRELCQGRLPYLEMIGNYAKVDYHIDIGDRELFQGRLTVLGTLSK
jgi:hypothetical protein